MSVVQEEYTANIMYLRLQNIENVSQISSCQIYKGTFESFFAFPQKNIDKIK
jgi:hypothetical protein